MAKKKVTVEVVRVYKRTVKVEVEIDEDIQDIATELTDGKVSAELTDLVEGGLAEAQLKCIDGEEWRYDSECGIGGTL